MAQFYGSMQGNRGEATRCGGKSSGITAHVRGWQSGVRVMGFDVDGADVFHIVMTSGSNGGREQVIGRVILVDGVPTFTPAAAVR